MTKTAIITGLPGSELDSYIENEREIFISEKLFELEKELDKKGVKGKEKQQEMELIEKRVFDKIKIYNAGDFMEKIAMDMNLSYDFRHMLQLDREPRNMLLKLAYNEIEKRINRTEKPDVALIKAHAAFYEPMGKQFTRSIFKGDFKDLHIDRICCMINDEILIRKSLKKYPQYEDVEFSNEKILDWMSLEIEKSEELFQNLGLKKKWNDRMQVFSRYLSTTSLYKYLMFDNVPVIYTVYPMTAVHGNKKVAKEIQRGIWLMNHYGIVKDPKAGDAGYKTGGVIAGIIDQEDASRDDLLRSTYCVNRDIGYLVDKSDIIFGNYPIDTFSDGMNIEMWRGFSKTKLTLLKVGEKTRSIVSPFRTYSQRAIKRTYDEIEEYLQEEGYQPMFKDLMGRWGKEYHDIKR